MNRFSYLADDLGHNLLPFSIGKIRCHNPLPCSNPALFDILATMQCSDKSFIIRRPKHDSFRPIQVIGASHWRWTVPGNRFPVLLTLLLMLLLMMMATIPSHIMSRAHIIHPPPHITRRRRPQTVTDARATLRTLTGLGRIVLQRITLWRRRRVSRLLGVRPLPPQHGLEPKGRSRTEGQFLLPAQVQAAASVGGRSGPG